MELCQFGEATVGLSDSTTGWEVRGVHGVLMGSEWALSGVSVGSENMICLPAVEQNFIP